MSQEQDPRLESLTRSNSSSNTKKKKKKRRNIQPKLRGKTIQPSEWVFFFRALAAMFDAGIPLSDCFHFLAESSAQPRLKRISANIAKALSQGKDLEQACVAPEFKPLHKAMFKVGQETGNLSEVLNELAGYEEGQAKLVYALRSAVFYPQILLGLAFLFALAVPSFFEGPITDLFASTNVSIPVVFLALFQISNLFWTPVFWAGLVVAVIIWGSLVRKLLSGAGPQRLIWGVLLKLPGAKGIVQTVCEERLASTLALTRRAGLPELQAFPLIGEVMGNLLYQEACLDITDSIENGATVGESLEETEVFSRSFVAIVNCGEEAGKLPKLLESYSKLLSMKIEENLKSALTMLEPFLLAGMALMVGGFAVAALRPLTQVIQAL